MKINFQPISNILGIMLMLLGISMFCTAGISAYYQADDLTAFILSGSICLATGFGLWMLKFGSDSQIQKREGYLIVSLAWFFLGLFGAMPFYFSGVTPLFTDALFESVSGFTTTGASIFSNVESLPEGILFWRSLTHWIGGMGIVVLTVALFPMLGIAGIELFVAESPGPTADKLKPRIKETAKRFWFIYFGALLIGRC